MLERQKRAIREKGLLISPFCMAIMIAMAQRVPPQQQVCLYPYRSLSYKLTLMLILQVTLFLPSHERKPDHPTISPVYEYTLKASHAFLQKFDQPYNAFESDLTIHRRTIPFQKETSDELLLQAVQRASMNHSFGQTNNQADHENATSIISLPVDSNKREALDVLDNNIPSKRVKTSESKGSG